MFQKVKYISRHFSRELNCDCVEGISSRLRKKTIGHHSTCGITKPSIQLPIPYKWQLHIQTAETDKAFQSERSTTPSEYIQIDSIHSDSDSAGRNIKFHIQMS